MTAVRVRFLRRVVRASVAAVLVLSVFAVFDADAQGRRSGHVLHHDSSNPTPGHTKGRGKVHQQPPRFSTVSASGVIMSAPVQVAATRAVMGVQGMLRNRSLMADNGLEVSDEVQTELAGLLDGTSDFAILSLVDALRGPDNEVAASEAARLVTLLARLADEPEQFPAVAIAYNDFIDRSSDAFVLDPPEEILAIRAVLFTVLEPTLRAAEEDDDEDDEEEQGQQQF
ncbi:MAG: hypothetical protein OEU54_07725 [Gemmatimonadota bacterium]|nr:hypothetical protein [Gemmatimonadota bacterium]